MFPQTEEFGGVFYYIGNSTFAMGKYLEGLGVSGFQNVCKNV